MSLNAAARARRSVLASLAGGALLVSGLAAAAPAAAVGTYQNVGLGISWDPGALGMTATFLEANGTDLNNCSGDLTNAACNFTFASEIDSAADNASAQPTTQQNPDGDYLPLVDGFGNGAFGQTFTATATGELTAFSMALTCLDQTGAGITGVDAAIYETNDLGTAIVSDSLAGGPVDLSTCPTDATAGSVNEWAPTAYAMVPLPVTGASLVSGHHYTVLFGGTFVGGVQPPGLSSTPSAPTNLAAAAGDSRLTVSFTAPADDGGSAITGYDWTTDDGGTWNSAGRTTSPITITGLTNGTAYTVKLRAVNANGSGIASDGVTGTPAASVGTVVRPVLATWTSVAGHQSTLRLLRYAGSPRATLATSTPAVCSVKGSLVVFHVSGTCRVSVVQSGSTWKTLTARVSTTKGATGAATADHVRSIPFAPDSSTLSDAAKATLRSIAPRLRLANMVVVHGFAAGDIPSGRNAYTWRLTEARAQSVAKYLRSLGVHVLYAHGFNTWLPLDAVHPFSGVNRRADVAFI
ncbi:MAG: fibronectin type III domain-containing protein [Candidatus Nanopelagicales bacterium]